MLLNLLRYTIHLRNVRQVTVFPKGKTEEEEEEGDDDDDDEKNRRKRRRVT